MEQVAEKQLIDGDDLWQWFFLGAREVFANRTYINSINLFPVADGDTGTNLAITMNAMVEKSQRNENFSEMIQNISQSGLAHARGNSGILFATYINGLAQEVENYNEINKQEFSQIAYRGVRYLYEAIESPVEGTMITVIREWAEFLWERHESYDSFQELLEDGYQLASISLENTMSQLEVLRKNKVVDSGGDGFLKFLRGINRFFSGGQVEQEERPMALVFDQEDHEECGEYRFCTEIYMEQYEKGEQELKAQLSLWGDSLIVSTMGKFLRVHIHTNEPEKVVHWIKDFGRLVEQKVDDMFLQNQVKYHPMSKVAIVTDSIADIPEEYKWNHQVHTLPLGLWMDSIVYLDKRTIQLPQLYQELTHVEEYPTSSQPEPGRIKLFLKQLLEQYESIIFISVSSQLSGTYQSLCQGVASMDLNGKKVTIVDSKLNSGAQGLLVRLAAESMKQGMTHDEILDRVKEQISKTSIYVCLSTLAYAVKSGRVPDKIGKFGMMIGLRPIMTLDKEGKGAAFGIGFRKKTMTRKIMRIVTKKMRTTGIKEYSIVHGGNESLALEYQELLTKIVGKEPEFVTEISSIVAIHSGKGCVAVSIVEA